MTVPLVALGSLSVGSFATSIMAAAQHHANPIIPAILGTAAVLGAIATIWKWLHLGEIARGVRNFLVDWNGEEARPGADRKKGVPERLAQMEDYSHQMKGTMPTIASGLEALFKGVDANGKKTDRLDERLVTVDARITDHRRRNDEQSKLLSEELQRRYEDLDRKLRDRDAAVDARLDSLSEDLLRAEMMRAALLELGIDLDDSPRSKP